MRQPTSPFAGREIPRLVIRELDDPPNGDFEQRPASELTDWRERHGPDVAIPGTGRSERDHVLAMLPGVELLLSRPEPTIVAVLHGWLVGWIAGAATGGGGSMPGHATPTRSRRAQLERALGELRRDPYRYG